MAAAVTNVLVNLLLIPRWGAAGAAVGTSGTMVLHNVLKQYGLWRYTEIGLFSRSYLPTYIALFGVAGALLLAQTVLPPSLSLAAGVTLAAALAVVWACRRALQVDAMFPELARWPLTRALVQPSRSL